MNACLKLLSGWLTLTSCVLVLAADPAPPAADTPAAEKPPAAKQAPQPTMPTQAELEKQFAETLSGAVMVGRFTDNTQKADQPLKEDRYTLGKVSKLKGDTWLFQTRIEYGEHDVSLPLPLTVKWAGDTPVITLTDMQVPGLGKFTARVVVYRGEYAGTWSGGDHGGHLFGKIERPANGNKPADKPAKDTGKVPAGKTSAPKSKHP